MKKDYYNIPKINVYAIFNESKKIGALNILKKLINENKFYNKLKDKGYFKDVKIRGDSIEWENGKDVAEYYENEEKLPTEITKEDYRKIREILDNISY